MTTTMTVLSLLYSQFYHPSGCVDGVCPEEPQKPGRDTQLAGKCYEGVWLCWVIISHYLNHAINEMLKKNKTKLVSMMNF